MRKLPDLGEWSEEECRELAILALSEISLNERINAVLECFAADERDRLIDELREDESPGDAA